MLVQRRRLWPNIVHNYWTNEKNTKQPSVIASRPFQIWYRSANFLKVYITASAIMQHFRDNKKKQFEMSVGHLGFYICKINL